MGKYSTCSNAGNAMRNMGNMKSQDFRKALLTLGRTLDYETGFLDTMSSKKQKRSRDGHEAQPNVMSSWKAAI